MEGPSTAKRRRLLRSASAANAPISLSPFPRRRLSNGSGSQAAHAAEAQAVSGWEEMAAAAQDSEATTPHHTPRERARSTKRFLHDRHCSAKRSEALAKPFYQQARAWSKTRQTLRPFPRSIPCGCSLSILNPIA
jgi:hypothetical protein